MEVDILFEVISASIRQNTLVDDVDFADDPRIEPWFGEKFIKQVRLADLHIAAPQAKTLNV